MAKQKKKTTPEDILRTMPFGKYRGFKVEEVMRVEPTYLVWFVHTIQECLELRELIQTLPGYPAAEERWQKQKQKQEWKTGCFSPESVDAACELFYADDEKKPDETPGSEVDR